MNTNNTSPTSRLLRHLTAGALALVLTATALAQGSTAFTYQGRLTDGVNPATGTYDLQFTLYDSAGGAGTVGSPVPILAVGVTNGLFTVALDFGAGLFDGAARWLEIAARTNDASTYATLAPRQPLTPAPYALYAPAAGSVPAAGLTGTLPDALLSANVALLDSSPTFSGTVRAAQLEVRAGQAVGRFLSTNGSAVSFLELRNTAASASWLGAINFNNSSNTTPGQISYDTIAGLTFRAGGAERLRITPAGNVGIGTNDPAGAALSVAGTVRAPLFQGSGASLTGLDAAQVTTGTLPDSQLPANVARTNQVWLLGGNAGTTAGGQFLGTTDDEPLELRVNNQRGLRLETTGTNDTVNVIGGSARNSVGAGVEGATIGGGVLNTIQTTADFATIGGGSVNTIQTTADYAAIGGGSRNTIQTNADYATIGGGYSNTIQTNADYATIPGGRSNEATNYAFAAGFEAHALHTGAFVWSDGSGTETVSTNANSVTFRARGGYRLFSSSLTSGVFLAAGSGTWTAMSDRNSKENFEAVNPREVLDKVAALPVSRWNYKTQAASVRHLGPMAQDFQAAFAVGESDTGITTVDADGVALAAIQGLNQKLQEELGSVRADNAALKARLDRLEQLISAQNGGGK